MARTEETDHPIIRKYCESLAEELQSIGYSSAFAYAMILPLETLDTAISFTPLTAFSQTPGPHAGKQLTA
ncbi:MAG: hypothetical protein L0Z73_16995 [Gammaproteobacteria bacterium]|nr:hypothetical protein [Gammaproteobacteria bacterium]